MEQTRGATRPPPMTEAESEAAATASLAIEHPDRTEALAALLSAEDNGIQSSQQISMAVIGVIGAYLPVALFAVYQGVGKELFAWLPLPLALLVFFQLVQTAQTARRRSSSAIVEAELARIGGLSDDLQAERVGAPARDAVVNLGYILDHRGDRWLSRLVAAAVPALGLPIVGMAFTWFMVSLATAQNTSYPGRLLTVVVPAVLSILVWTFYVDSVMSYFTPDYRINIWVPVAALAGIWFQWNQPLDPTPAWLYFSVLSAALIAVAAVLRPLRLPGHEVVERAGIAGILVSALGFWVYIFPEARFGFHEEQIWANLAMHVVAPVVAVLGLLARRSPLRPLSRGSVLAMLVLPAGWLTAIVVAHRVARTPLPYKFLDPSRGGWPMTIMTSLIVTAAFLLLGNAERVWRSIRRPAVDA